MRLLTNNSPKKFLPLILASAVTAALTACGGGGGGSDSAAVETPAPQPVASKVEATIDSTFAAILMGRIDHNAQDSESSNTYGNQPTASAVDYYDAVLTAVSTATGIEQTFDWPLVVDEAGMIGSQKTVTIEPGTYNFTLAVTKGSQQYIGMLAEFVIDDEGEIRLPMNLEPVIGDTIVNIDVTPAQLSLEYPASELVSIAAPQVGIIIDGEEHIFAINTTTGIADVLLNLPLGAHDYEVKLYNGDIQIGRSKEGSQTLDLVKGDAFNIDLISLQADITVDGLDTDEPKFIFKIPQEVIDYIGDISNLSLYVKLVDGEGEFKDVSLPVQEVDGEYIAEHVFDYTIIQSLTANLEFQDISGAEPVTFAQCADSVAIAEINDMACNVGIGGVQTFSGNLLATLSINVLQMIDDQKIDQSGAEVFVDGVLAGITGSSFGTDGFLKVFVKAGEGHIARAEKAGLEDANTLIPSALSINNFDLILDSAPNVVEGTTCKTILDSGNSIGSGLYVLDADGSGPLDSFTTYCDMDTKGGGWTLVQNRGHAIDLTTTYDLAGAVAYQNGFSLDESLYGAISNDNWNKLKESSTELQTYIEGDGLGNIPDEEVHYLYTTFERISDNQNNTLCSDLTADLLNPIIFWHETSGCTGTGLDYDILGWSIAEVAQVINFTPDIWIDSTMDTGTNAYRLSIYIR